MEVTMLLCDAASESGGKLFVLGGGWSVAQAESPLNMALAIKFLVPWDEANRVFAIKATLLDDDGRPVDSGSGPVAAEGSLEVGRPAGVKAGTPIDVPMVLNLSGIALGAGGYVWRLEVDDELKARVPFRAVPPDQEPAQQD